MGAIAAAIILHAAILVLRPGVSGGPVSTPAASVLAVRILHPALVAPTTPTSAEPSPAVASAQEYDASLATKLKAAVAADATSSDRTDQRSGPRPATGSPPRAEPAAPQSGALADAPDYALSTSLDPGPRPLDEIDPDYPDTVNLRSGTVVLRLLISDTGHVDDVGVVRAEPQGVFEKAAIEAFAKARFSPGMASGAPVKSQIRVEVQFMPINRGGRVSGRSY
jgi:protein TonB